MDTSPNMYGARVLVQTGKRCKSSMARPILISLLLLTILNDAVELCYFAIQLDENRTRSAVAHSLLFGL